MEIFLVGGALRNQLLGLPVKEKDWVVVGSSPEEMLALNYKPVGKDFPVFLHPTTYEEYALARTERKVGKGYQGFEFYTARDVTLLDDLKRRDLTINAIAQTDSGELIDPYKGQDDIKARLFRHVSPAFAEDPVRILRAARFAAQLPEFTVAPDTNELMRKMVDQGEVDALISERVWKECEKALLAEQPSRFFEVLDACHASTRLWPALALEHSHFQHFKHLCSQTSEGPTRFAVLTHPLALKDLNALLQRYRVPKNYKEHALLVHQAIRDLPNMNRTDSQEIFSLLKSLDALRRPHRYLQVLKTCQYCIPIPNYELLKALPTQLNAIDTLSLQQQGFSGKALGHALEEQRLECIDQILRK